MGDRTGDDALIVLTSIHEYDNPCFHGSTRTALPQYHYSRPRRCPVPVRSVRANSTLPYSFWLHSVCSSPHSRLDHDGYRIADIPIRVSSSLSTAYSYTRIHGKAGLTDKIVLRRSIHAHTTCTCTQAFHETYSKTRRLSTWRDFGFSTYHQHLSPQSQSLGSREQVEYFVGARNSFYD